MRTVVHPGVLSQKLGHVLCLGSDALAPLAASIPALLLPTYTRAWTTAIAQEVQLALRPCGIRPPPRVHHVHPRPCRVVCARARHAALRRRRRTGAVGLRPLEASRCNLAGRAGDKCDVGRGGPGTAMLSYMDLVISLRIARA